MKERDSAWKEKGWSARRKSSSVSGDSLQEWRRRDEPPRGPEVTTGTLTTTGREAGTTSIAEARVEGSLERVAIRDSRGQAPVTSISPAAEATVTEAGDRMTGTLGDQDTSREVEVAEEVEPTTTTEETTPGEEEEEAGEETTEMSRGAAMVMETIPMQDMGTPLMGMATPLMGMETPLTDTAPPLTDMATPLMGMATLGQGGSPTLDSEVQQVAATSTTLGLA